MPENVIWWSGWAIVNINIQGMGISNILRNPYGILDHPLPCPQDLFQVQLVWAALKHDFQKIIIFPFKMQKSCLAKNKSLIKLETKYGKYGVFHKEDKVEKSRFCDPITADLDLLISFLV